MFIKLTRLDNTPIWLNASFIVTVEPRKGGGTIVVPVGDGLDYEVREKAEVVLDMLADAPAPTVVPVPSSDCLTQTPDDVSPEPERKEPEVAVREERPVEKAAAEPAPQPEPSAEEAEKPVRKTTRKAAAKKTTTAKPRKRTTKKAAAAEEDAKDETPSEPPPAAPKITVEPVAPVEPPKPAQEVGTLSESQVERLRRMMPRSIRKLTNTLMAQFKVIDTMPVIQALAERGILRLDNDRVIWI